MVTIGHTASTINLRRNDHDEKDLSDEYAEHIVGMRHSSIGMSELQFGAIGHMDKNDRCE
jgi:hypothetical protein